MTSYTGKAGFSDLNWETGTVKRVKMIKNVKSVHT